MARRRGTRGDGLHAPDAPLETAADSSGAARTAVVEEEAQVERWAVEAASSPATRLATTCRMSAQALAWLPSHPAGRMRWRACCLRA